MSSATMTKNDLHVLESVIEAVDGPDYDGFAPHTSADWTAIRRLEKAGLVQCDGHGICDDCDDPKHRSEPTEVQLYVPTTSGRAAYARAR